MSEAPPHTQINIYRHLQQGGKIPLLVVVGPTAVGKTAFAIDLAIRTGGEIVSADSVQVYRYLDKGSAKPSVHEMKGISHHLIDMVDPDLDFTVYDYQRQAKKTIFQLNKRGKIPVLTGGTGLYIKAVLDEFVFSSTKANPKIRKRLEEAEKLKGKEYLFSLLKECDHAAAKRIHPHDSRRISRALEFFYLTGEPISRQWEMTETKQSPYSPLVIGLQMPRELLYERINQRVELMAERRIIDEVRELLRCGYNKDLKSMQSLGYRHVISYLEGKWGWDEAVSNWKRDTRRYAKRQLTWFRADKRVHWFELEKGDHFSSILDTICAGEKGF